MKRFCKAGNILCLLIAMVSAVFLLVAVPRKAQAADTNRYGYRMLTTAKQKQTYGLLADALLSGTSDVSLSQVGITYDDLSVVLDLVLNDYPEVPGLSGYTYIPQGNQVASVQFSYVAGANVQGAIAALDSKASQIASGAKGSDYQKALYLHDYIVRNVTYEQTGDHQSAYGALVGGKAVCAGYTRAYQLLLRKAGIDSFYVAGSARKANGSVLEHAWLLVFLDGECYYTDVTWDDATDSDGKPLTGHYYFNMSYDDIVADHFADPKYNQWLPSDHAHTRLNYFEQEKKEGGGVGWFNSSSAPETLYNYLKKDGNTYTCDFRFDGDNVSAWLSSALQSCSDRLSNIQPVCQGIGHEYLLTFTADTRHTPGNWQSDASKHWQTCATCGAVVDETSAAHSDSNGDNTCDTCGYKLPGGSSATQNTPTSGSSASAPTGGTSTPPAGDGASSAEGDFSSADPTLSTTAPDSPETKPTGDTTPSEDIQDATTPSSGTEDDLTTPTQSPQHDEENGEDNTVVIIAVCAVAVLGGAGAVVFVILRKKRIS